MKKYEKPEIELIIYSTGDVICISDPDNPDNRTIDSVDNLLV